VYRESRSQKDGASQRRKAHPETEKEAMMKKTIFTTFTLLGCLVMLIGVGAQAQTDTAMRAQVPFEFNIKRQTLPADQYVVQVKRLGATWALQISRGRETEGIYPVTQQMIRGNAPETPRLIFHRYGEQYFLAQVQLGNDREALSLPKSRLEEEVRTAMQGAAPIIVAVNLTQL
jgi:hypothetical protein